MEKKKVVRRGLRYRREFSRNKGCNVLCNDMASVAKKRKKKKEKEKKNEHHASGMEWKTKDESRLESRANIFWAISERDQGILSIGFIPSGDKGGRYTK